MNPPPPKLLSPVKAGLLSAFVFPGAGQWYNGDRLKAILFGAAGAGLMAVFISTIVGLVNEALTAALNAEDFTEPALPTIQVPPSLSWVSWGLFILWTASLLEAIITARTLRERRRLAAQADLAPPIPRDPAPSSKP